MDFLNGIDFMGESIKEKLKFCGESVRIYPLCKVIRAENALLDDRCQLFDNVFIDAGEELKIGKYSTITWFCLIEGGAKTQIGDRVFVGPGTKLLTSTYKLNGYFSVEHIPEVCRGTEYGDIIIENDAYIGANCTIMPGTIIREGAVIGANSFVKGEMEPWAVYAGSPCIKISMREKPSLDKQTILNELNWEKHF